MRPAPSPTRSAYGLQALVLQEVKAFPRSSLRHRDAVRVTDLTGRSQDEPWPRLQQPQLDWGDEAYAAAAAALARLRLRPSSKKDALPCRVAEGLYIGGAGAARNIKALRKRGITHVVNASPTVPCHFRDNPEGCFEYLALPLFDDPEADLAPHIAATNAFIAAARSRGGAVLVHCYAGQSRSAALVIAHLVAARPGLGLMEAWALVRAARPCAQPNSGFLRQLASYAKAHQAAAAAPGQAAGGPIAAGAAAALQLEVDDSAADLLMLTQ